MKDGRRPEFEVMGVLVTGLLLSRESFDWVGCVKGVPCSSGLLGIIGTPESSCGNTSNCRGVSTSDDDVDVARGRAVEGIVRSLVLSASDCSITSEASCRILWDVGGRTVKFKVTGVLARRG